MSEIETGAPRKRRRRRRRGKGFSSPAAPASGPLAVQDAPEWREGVNIKPLTGKALTLDLPARFGEILHWAARASGQTDEAMAVQILRGVLSGMKPAWREAMHGSAGASAPKGAATDRLLERKRPSST